MKHFKMWRLWRAGLIFGWITLITGCDLLGPPMVKVRLVNHSDVAVDPQFYRSGSPAEGSGLFESTNLYTDFAKGVLPAVGAGKTVEFELDCEEAAALGVANPVFAMPGEKSSRQTAATISLRVGRDYACGDVVTFEFSADADKGKVTHRVVAR